MPITVVGVGNAAGESAGTTTTASTVSVTPTRHASSASGDRIVVLQGANNTSASTPANWTAVFKDTVVGSGAAGAGTGQRYLSYYYRDYDGSWSMPAFTLTSAAQNTQTLACITLRKDAADTWITPTVSSTATYFGTAGTAFTATTSSFTTMGCNAGAPSQFSILLAGSVFNDNVTMTSGAVTGTNGFTSGTVTERVDGGSATGNDVSLKLHTAWPTTRGQPAGTLTHTGTLSAASQGGVVFVQQTASPPKVDTLTDNFDSGLSAAWSTTGGSVTNESGAVRVSHGVGPDFQRFYSNAYYNLTGVAAYVEIKDFGNQALTWHHVDLALESNDDDRLITQVINNKVKVYSAVHGSYTQVGSDITLNTTNHRWLRIREAAGTIYWDAAPDGSTWSNLQFLATPFPVIAMLARVECSVEDTEATSSSGLIDNFNTPPSGTNYTPTITPEAVGITDSMTKDVGETTTDAVGITDSVAKDAGRTLTDTVGVSDSLTKDAARSDTDAVGITDSVTKEAGKTSTDNVGVTDSYVQTQDWARSVTDLVGVTDSASFSLTYFASTTDPVGLTDAVSAALGFDRSVTDLVGVTDAVSAQQDWVRSPTDPVGAQDSLSSSVGKVYTDPVGITDSSIALDQGRLATDPLSIADAVSKDIGKTATDPVGVTDSAVWTRSLAFADLVGLTDSFAKVSAYVQSQIDPVGVVDSATFVGTSAGNVDAVDLVGITDSLSAQQSRIVSFTDSVGVTDSFSKDAGRAATDPVGVADSLSTTSGYVRPAADAVAINDALVWASSQEASNAVGLSDAATFELSYIRALTDPVGVTDNLSVSLVSVFSDTDAVGIADFATFTLGDNVLNATDPVGIMDSGRFFIFLPPSPDNSWVPRGESVQHIPKTEAVRYAVKIESTHSEVAG